MEIEKFGWNEIPKETGILAVKEFFDGEILDENAEKILGFLLSEVDKTLYCKTCFLKSEKEQIILYQSGEKDYYHDGSVQPRKIIKFERSSETLYSTHKEVPLFNDYKNYKSFNLCLNEKQVQDENMLNDPIILARDFFGIDLVKIEITVY